MGSRSEDRSGDKTYPSIIQDSELIIADFEAPRFLAFAEMQTESNKQIQSTVLDDSPFYEIRKFNIFARMGILYTLVDKTHLRSHDLILIDDRKY